MNGANTNYSPAWRQFIVMAIVLPMILPWLASCGTTSIFDTQDAAPSSPDVADLNNVRQPIPRVEPRSRYGNPASYTVNGRTYRTLSSSDGYAERGIASWYGTKFHGRRTSSGEVYDIYKFTAAHRTLPLPSYVRVTNLRNGRSIIVKVNDRGPFYQNRIIDLSYVAAHRLGILGKGTGLVEIRAINAAVPAPVSRPAAALPTSPPPASPIATPVATAQATAPVAVGPILMYVQVGAFTNLGNAQRLQKRLQSVNIDQVSLSPTNTRQTRLYRVRIGPIPDVEKADELTTILQAMGIGQPQIVID
ncbi:MAG: septal ring lytic transglycosylase RlpA family protein [Gammaproteobacteria bacterium]|nr:MAG: septal ring lytic transglycosylase RlpA family protein [Gammaproteobacteria bacterium]